MTLLTPPSPPSPPVQTDGVADCIIISDSYWPSLQVEEVRHHARISSLLEAYAAEFAVAKKPMKLDVIPQLGGHRIELAICTLLSSCRSGGSGVGI